MFMGARAKVCNTDFAKWMNIEIGCLVGMFMIFGFAVLPTATTYNFVRMHGALTDAADADISGIDSMMAAFDRTETERMDGTYRGLENYLRLGNHNCSPALANYIQGSLGSSTQYFSQNIINNNRGTVQAKIDDLRLGNRMYRNTFNNAVDKLHGIGSSRIPLGYGNLSQQLDTISSQIGTVLTEISASLNLPVVYAGNGDQYTIRNTEPTVYSFRPTEFALEFAYVDTMQWQSIILSVLSILVAMFYYLISYRAIRKAVDKGQKISDSLGLPL